jgi:hypothetical protein|tara:strand:+ start:216 stop:506 length:291 start_codon:yes stop_codon:yes gene_type:complete
MEKYIATYSKKSGEIRCFEVEAFSADAAKHKATRKAIAEGGKLQEIYSGAAASRLNTCIERCGGKVAKVGLNTEDNVLEVYSEHAIESLVARIKLD